MGHIAFVAVSILLLLDDGGLLLNEEGLVEHLYVYLNLLNELFQLFIGERVEHGPNVVPQLIFALQVLVGGHGHGHAWRELLGTGLGILVTTIIAHHSIAVTVIVVLRVLLMGIHLWLRGHWVPTSSIEL